MDTVDGFPEIQDKTITSSGPLVSLIDLVVTPLVLRSFDFDDFVKLFRH